MTKTLNIDLAKYKTPKLYTSNQEVNAAIDHILSRRLRVHLARKLFEVIHRYTVSDVTIIYPDSRQRISQAVYCTNVPFNTDILAVEFESTDNSITDIIDQEYTLWILRQ